MLNVIEPQAKFKEVSLHKSIIDFTAEQKIVVMDKNECIFLKIADICYIKANGSYSKLFLVDDKIMVVSKNLKVFAEKLSNALFIRVHKSYLVNSQCISKYVKGVGGNLIMNNGAAIPVSLNKRNDLIQLVEQGY